MAMTNTLKIYMQPKSKGLAPDRWLKLEIDLFSVVNWYTNIYVYIYIFFKNGRIVFWVGGLQLEKWFGSISSVLAREAFDTKD